MGADKVIKRYRKKAHLYESKRADTDKWRSENQGVMEMMPLWVKSVIDVPVGTGRFYPIYKERGIKAVGIDSSLAMLEEAKKKRMSNLEIGDIRNLIFDDKSFDCAVCVRLMAWFEPQEVKATLKELSRVSNIIVINIRTNKGEPFCKNNSLWNHSYSDFISWVKDIGYDVQDVFHCGNKGNDIYRLGPIA